MKFRGAVSNHAFPRLGTRALMRALAAQPDGLPPLTLRAAFADPAPTGYRPPASSARPASWLTIPA